MPLSRVQQEKASVPQHSVSGVLCHSENLKEPHLDCSFVTSLAVLRQLLWVWWTVETSQAQGSSSSWSVGLVPRSPCSCKRGISWTPPTPSGLYCKISICQAAWLFLTGLTGQEGQGRADSQRAADLAQPPPGALASQQSHSQGERWGSTSSPEKKVMMVPIPRVCSYLLFPLVQILLPSLSCSLVTNNFGVTVSKTGANLC